MESTRKIATLNGVLRTLPYRRTLVELLAARELSASLAIDGTAMSIEAILIARTGRMPEGPAAMCSRIIAPLDCWTTSARQTGFPDIFALAMAAGCGLRTTDKRADAPPALPKAEKLHGTIGKMSKFLSKNDGVDPLVKMALVHRQMKLALPFAEYNGTLIRFAGLLVAVSAGVMDIPVLGISSALARKRETCRKLSVESSSTEGLENYLGIMLDILGESAERILETVMRIDRSRKELRASLRESGGARELFDVLFQNPVASIPLLQNELGITRQTAATRLNALADSGLLAKRRCGKELLFLNERLLSALKTECDVRIARAK